MIDIDLLIVGGEGDFNLHHLQKAAKKMNIRYKTCFSGASGTPSIILDIHQNLFKVNGYAFKPNALFIRPDVTTFASTKKPIHQRLASDWFEIFLGWAMANDDIRVFNRRYFNRNKINKVANLLLAKQIGISVAETYYTNDLYFMQNYESDHWIEKPVHGGAHTKLLNTSNKIHDGSGVTASPITLQAKMIKPEYRFFRVGNHYRAFTMNSPSLDYREKQDAQVEEVEFPEAYKPKFQKLTDILKLDFAAADYISDPESQELCFLEVNSGPMFAAFDYASGGELCREMITYLLEKPH